MNGHCNDSNNNCIININNIHIIIKWSAWCYCIYSFPVRWFFQYIFHATLNSEWLRIASYLLINSIISVSNAIFGARMNGMSNSLVLFIERRVVVSYTNKIISHFIEQCREFNFICAKRIPRIVQFECMSWTPLASAIYRTYSGS